MDTQNHFDGVLCPHSRETYPIWSIRARTHFKEW